MERLLDDPDPVPVEPASRPLLAYARKLTLEPSKVVAADAQAVFEAGWTERDLHDVVLTIGLFKLINHLLERHGAKGQDHFVCSNARRCTSCMSKSGLTRATIARIDRRRHSLTNTLGSTPSSGPAPRLRTSLTREPCHSSTVPPVSKRTARSVAVKARRCTRRVRGSSWPRRSRSQRAARRSAALRMAWSAPRRNRAFRRASR